MSARLMNCVINNGPSQHPDFSVLLILASHANDHGGDCWPSVKLITVETRMSERSVARSLASLEQEGWITLMRRSRNHKGSAYQIVIEKLASRARVAGKTPNSHAPQAGDTAKPHATVAGENEILTCQIEKSHLPDSPKSPAKSASPIYETSVKRQETSTPLAAPIARFSSSSQNTTENLPGWLDGELWSTYIEMRKQIRKPMTRAGKVETLRQLEQFQRDGIDPNACLRESVRRSWGDVFSSRASSAGNHTAAQDRGGKTSGAQAAAEEYARLKQQQTPAKGLVIPIGMVANG